MNHMIQTLELLQNFSNPQTSPDSISTPQPLLKKPRKPYSKRSHQTNQNRTFGHWTYEEQQTYYLFLEQHKEKFLKRQMRRTDRIFKEMSRKLGTRTAEQCRSHHQKMEKKCNTFESILEILRDKYAPTPQFIVHEQDVTNCLSLYISHPSEDFFSSELSPKKQDNKPEEDTVYSTQNSKLWRDSKTTWLEEDLGPCPSDLDIDVVDLYLN